SPGAIAAAGAARLRCAASAARLAPPGARGGWYRRARSWQVFVSPAVFTGGFCQTNAGQKHPFFLILSLSKDRRTWFDRLTTNGLRSCSRTVISVNSYVFVAEIAGPDGVDRITTAQQHAHGDFLLLHHA